ncbi:MAG: hypothetical protein LBF57_01435 [Holosporaceae bacterium]|jgi:hypothetical protein|nr:hypothetical protein [Holosporaceae bacterium]
MRKYYAFIFLVSIFLVVLILKDANWIIGDDYQFLITTAINKIIVGGMENGRYYPLGFFDYNILLLLPYGHTPLAHYIYVSITCLTSIILFVFLINLIIEKRNGGIMAYYFMVLVCSSGFCRVNMHIIFPERIIITGLSVFMVCYFYALKTDKLIYYVLGFLCASYLSYCKEPIFGAFLVIAITNLIFNRQKRKHFYFNCALITNAIIYITQWYFLVARNSTKFYSHYGVINNIFEATKFAAIDSERILIAIFILSLVRGYFVFIKKDQNHLFLDSLLFFSASYALAFIKLYLVAGYYFVPSVLTALPSFAYWTKVGIEKRKTFTTISAVIFMTYFTLYNINRSVHWINAIQEKRKTDMETVEKLSEFIRKGIPFYLFDNKSVIYSDYMLNVWTVFFNYFLKEEVHIQKIEETSIPDYGVILYPTPDIQAVGIINELTRKGFKFWDRKAVTNFYIKSHH